MEANAFFYLRNANNTPFGAVALYKNNHDTCSVGVSVRNPSDAWDKKIARLIAVGRARSGNFKINIDDKYFRPEDIFTKSSMSSKRMKEIRSGNTGAEFFKSFMDAYERINKDWLRINKGITGEWPEGLKSRSEECAWDDQQKKWTPINHYPDNRDEALHLQRSKRAAQRAAGNRPNPRLPTAETLVNSIDKGVSRLAELMGRGEADPAYNEECDDGDRKNSRSNELDNASFSNAFFYLRDDNNNPIGAVALYKNSNDSCNVGISICCPRDTWDRKLAKEIAVGRALKGRLKIHTGSTRLIDILKRSEIPVHILRAFELQKNIDTWLEKTFQDALARVNSSWGHLLSEDESAAISKAMHSSFDGSPPGNTVIKPEPKTDWRRGALSTQAINSIKDETSAMRSYWNSASAVAYRDKDKLESVDLPGFESIDADPIAGRPPVSRENPHISCIRTERDSLRAEVNRAGALLVEEQQRSRAALADLGRELAARAMADAEVERLTAALAKSEEERLDLKIELDGTKKILSEKVLYCDNLKFKISSLNESLNDSKLNLKKCAASQMMLESELSGCRHQLSIAHSDIISMKEVIESLEQGLSVNEDTIRDLNENADRLISDSRYDLLNAEAANKCLELQIDKQTEELKKVAEQRDHQMERAERAEIEIHNLNKKLDSLLARIANG